MKIWCGFKIRVRSYKLVDTHQTPRHNGTPGCPTTWGAVVGSGNCLVVFHNLFFLFHFSLNFPKFHFVPGSTVKQHKESLLKFFKLNDENPTSKNATLNITNDPGKCGVLTKKLCVQKHKSKSNTVKKSFRPYFYDDEDDEDSDEYDETPDDDDFPEEAETSSYRSYAPRDHERQYDDYSEDYDGEPTWRDQNFEDEDPEPHERPGYERDMDDWDWDSPRRHRERQTFKGVGINDQPSDFALA